MSDIGLDGRTLAQRVQEAIDFLQAEGYAVRGPLLYHTDVKTPAHLVRYFYDVLIKYRPENKTIYGGNKTKDLVIAKQLIAARRKTGCTIKRAIGESCELIDLLFKHEDRLGLTFTVTSMSVLGQGKLVWVTERLLQIREGHDRQVSKDADESFFQDLFSSQYENIKQTNLDIAREKLDKVLENYGKKEKN